MITVTFSRDRDGAPAAETERTHQQTHDAGRRLAAADALMRLLGGPVTSERWARTVLAAWLNRTRQMNTSVLRHPSDWRHLDAEQGHSPEWRVAPSDGRGGRRP